MNGLPRNGRSAVPGRGRRPARAAARPPSRRAGRAARRAAPPCARRRTTRARAPAPRATAGGPPRGLRGPAAGLLALIGLFDIVGTTASGWLTDRYDSRRLLFWYYGLRGVSLLALPLAFDSTYAALLAFAVVYGLDWVATVPPTVRLTADTFGAVRAGVVFGWVFAAHQLGAATAA
jgi:hypothetical protein